MVNLYFTAWWKQSYTSSYFENIIFHILTFLLYRMNFRAILFPCTPSLQRNDYVRITMKFNINPGMLEMSVVLALFILQLRSSLHWILQVSANTIKFGGFLIRVIFSKSSSIQKPLHSVGPVGWMAWNGQHLGTLWGVYDSFTSTCMELTGVTRRTPECKVPISILLFTYNKRNEERDEILFLCLNILLHAGYSYKAKRESPFRILIEKTNKTKQNKPVIGSLPVISVS